MQGKHFIRIHLHLLISQGSICENGLELETIVFIFQYRPCDVFGYCTNTIGGYFCSCREGYTGDGKECRDIDECKDPELASLCVDNAECCNLPAHFVCKCNEGFEGDGTKECRGNYNNQKQLFK